MKHDVLSKRIYLLLLLLIASILIGNYATRNNTTLSAPMETSFEFCLTYNINGDNQISTFNDTYRMTSNDGTHTIPLAFTGDEMDKLLAFVEDNALMDTDFTDMPILVHFTPSESCTLHLKMPDGETKTIKWQTGQVEVIHNPSGTTTVNGQAKVLFEFETLIKEMIANRKDVQQLPPEKGYD